MEEKWISTRIVSKARKRSISPRQGRSRTSVDLKAVSEYLPDATLRIVDAGGNVVEEWVSGDEPHRIEMLAPGWYTLIETMAPEGYLVANDVRFEVLATGEVQTVVMSDELAPAPEEPGKGLPQTGDTGARVGLGL